MRKRYYWLLITILLLLIIGIILFFIWYIQKENIFKKLDNELLINGDISKHISTSWENDYIYWLQESLDGKTILMVMKGDGTEAKSVVVDNGNWNGYGNIEINSTSLLYMYICSGDERKLCIYDLKNKNKLKPDLSNDVQDLSWNSDGNRIVFIGRSSIDGIGKNIISIINSDGTDYREIVSGNNVPGHPAQPMISPDGSKILFHVNKENGDQGIYSMDSNGSYINSLIDTELKESEASYSPDGNLIIYSVSNETSQIWVMDTDGSNKKQLTQAGSNKSPFFSPDGNRLVFMSDRDNAGSWEIYSMNPDGSDQQRLTNNSLNDITPRWFRKKISIKVDREISNPGEILESFVLAKIGGDIDTASNLIHSNYKDNNDLTAAYQNLYLDEIGSYIILSEQDIEDGKKEYEISLIYKNESLGDERIYYQLELLNDNWVLSGVRIKENNETDNENSAQEDIQAGNISNNSLELESQQLAVDDGNDLWRLDPHEVAKREGGVYGFNQHEDIYTLISKIDVGDYSGTGEATVEISHSGVLYIVQLIQPIKQSDEGIWALNSIVKK